MMKAVGLRELKNRLSEYVPGRAGQDAGRASLATVLVAGASIEDLAILSLDRRVRASGTHLGLRVVPAPLP